MLNLNEEKNIFSQGYKLIGGIDEAGRGPLAGPVVAACVVVRRDNLTPLSPLCEERDNPSNLLYQGGMINDSKKLSAKKREEAFEFIINNFQYGIGICDHETIDRINILQASFLAMKKAISALKQKPEFILLDGKFSIPNLSIKQKAIIGGDALVFSIAAASIIAKVTRDRIMLKIHELYPQYEFNRHKGYGTKLHLKKLKEFGPSPIHRKSFKPVKSCDPLKKS